jgi:predicted ABC-type ATPase
MIPPILYIISGANGSGKTTFAMQYTQLHSLPFINADEIAKSINPDDLEKAKIQAGREFFKTFDSHLLENRSFAIESTLSGHYLKKIINRAKSLNYQIHIIYIYIDDTSPETNIQRVAARVLSGGHNIPRNDIVRRFHRSKFLFWTRYKYLSNKWILICNSGENFEEIAYWNGTDTTILNTLLFKNFFEGVTHDI